MTISLRRIRRARTRAIPCYLVVAMSRDLSDVQLTLQMLPICAHGRVIAIAEGDEQVAALDLPPRLGVTVLRVPRGASPARAASAAVEAWASEMLCDTDADFTTGDTDGADTAGQTMQVWFAGDPTEWRGLGDRLLAHHGLPAESLRLGSGLGAA